MRVAVAFFLLCAGCSHGNAEEDAGPIDAGMPRVELGTGSTGFVPIPETGAELELVAGPQGGFHVELTARIYDVNIEGLIISYDGTPVGAAAPTTYPTSITLDSTMVVREGDHWLRNDILRFMVSGPADIVGMQVDVRVVVQCISGLSAQDVRRATIVDKL
jgi:hypothetical protein